MAAIPTTAKGAKTGISGTRSLRIPITNIHGGHDYTARMLIGSNKVPANLILDTGSSTLAVKPTVYNAANDTDMAPTTLLQFMTYGTAGWAGPVVNTTLSFGDSDDAVTLQAAPIAITIEQADGNFNGADGILGLAFNALNIDYDLKNVQPTKPNTWPWPFAAGADFQASLTNLRNLLGQNLQNPTQIVPYFTELETNGVVANKFAFYTKRSFAHLATTNLAEAATDPLNNGFFILGGGEEQEDLYSGSFLDVDVMDDFYYNTNLIAVQVGDQPPVNAQPLQPEYSKMGTNSNIDTGTNGLKLTKDVYGAVIAGLTKQDASFGQMIINGAPENNGIPMSQLDLSKWPDICFILTGINGQEVKLCCSPGTYWQVNFPLPGKAVFQISTVQWPINQSILGLPLMNNYYTIFDRSADKNGIIRFAPIK